MGTSMISSLILATAITLTPSTGSSKNKEDALKAFAKATYIQTGTNKKVKEWEKENISKEVRKYGTIVVNIGKVIVEKRISYEWRF